MTPERRVKNKVRKWLKEKYPTAYVHMPVPVGYGKNNTLDFHVVIPYWRGPEKCGLPVAIETKACAARLTDRQANTWNELVCAGVLCLLIRNDWDVKSAERIINAIITPRV